MYSFKDVDVYVRTLTGQQLQYQPKKGPTIICVINGDPAPLKCINLRLGHLVK